MARLSTFLITVVLIVRIVDCAPRGGEIRDWYDLHGIRKNLGGSYVLINDLDSTTPGYDDLASPTANRAKGWQSVP